MPGKKLPHDPVKPGKKPQADPSPRSRRTFLSLDDETRALVQGFGAGNMSKGVRIAARLADLARKSGIGLDDSDSD